MNMNEDASVFRLRMLKERLQSLEKQATNRFWEREDKAAVQVVGIDLFRSIRNDDRLWQEWERRTKYLEHIATDQNFLKAEETAKSLSKNVVAVLIKIIKSHPDGENPKYGDMFFAEIKEDFPIEVDHPLPEKLAPYLKDENYFSINDQGQFMVAPSGRVWSLFAPPYDVGLYHNCNKILTQHQEIYRFVQRFVDTKLYDDIVRGKEEKENELAEAFQELAQAIEPLEMFLITEARALHSKSFETVQLAAASYDHSIMGRTTKGFQSVQMDEKRIEDIRKAGIDVCGELTYTLLLKMQGAEPPKILQKKAESKSVVAKVEPVRISITVPPVKAIGWIRRGTDQHEHDKIMWEVKRVEKTGEILVNGKLFSHPQIDGIPDSVFAVLFQNANNELKRRKSEQKEVWDRIDVALGKKSWTLSKVVTELKFKGPYKSIFFPGKVSTSHVHFRNSVTWDQCVREGLLSPEEIERTTDSPDMTANDGA